MPREYVDSCFLTPPAQFEQYIQLAHVLGYSEIWVAGLDRNQKEKISDIPLRVYLRLNLGEKNETKEQLAAILSAQRRNYPIISIYATTPDIAAWAAQDNRVDLITFPTLNFGRLMTRSIAKLMVKFEKLLEVNLAHIYQLPDRYLIPAFRQYLKALDIAYKKEVPVVFNSGARSLFEIRSPKELVFLAQVLSNETSPRLDEISRIPIELRTRNNLKISSDYVSPGVFRIQGGMEEE